MLLNLHRSCPLTIVRLYLGPVLVHKIFLLPVSLAGLQNSLGTGASGDIKMFDSGHSGLRFEGPSLIHGKKQNSQKFTGM